MRSRTTSAWLIFFSLLSNLIMACHTLAEVNKASLNTNLKTLQLVQIIARHGDRAPILPYPEDFYNNFEVYSSNGWGELTEMGARQVHELGTYLRQRYDGFLPRKYRKRDFLILSSDIDRAIMSAETNLAGLYGLGGVGHVPRSRSPDIFREWQPVPIHTIPEGEDNIINGKAPCPRHASLYKLFFQSQEFSDFLSDNKAFIDFIQDKSGLSAISENFNEIFQVQDALRCQRLHNLKLPLWANSTVMEKLDYFKALSFVWLVRTGEMKRLKVGPLFGRLVGDMRAKVEAASNCIPSNGGEEKEDEEITPYQDPVTHRKMYVYSGHDSTISGLLETLAIFSPPNIPDYASALIIELHRQPGSPGEFFVELLYRNGTVGGEPNRFDPFSFCGASSYCSFENFSNIARNFIPLDWNQECQLQPPSSYLLSLKKTTRPRAGPSDDGLDTPAIFVSSNNQDLEWNDSTHPSGFMTLTDHPGFVLPAIAAISLFASVLLLPTFLRHAWRISPQAYSHTSGYGSMA